MLGFFSPTKDDKEIVKKERITFVSFPDDLPEEEIRIRFSKLAKDFANAIDTNNVYLIYGKENSIEYEFKI